jgi:hypothetical protein
MAGSWSAGWARALRGCAGDAGPDVAVVAARAARCGRPRAARWWVLPLRAGRRIRPHSGGCRSCCRRAHPGRRKAGPHPAAAGLRYAPDSCCCRCRRVAPSGRVAGVHPCRAGVGWDGHWARWGAEEVAGVGRACPKDSAADGRHVRPAVPWGPRQRTEPAAARSGVQSGPNRWRRHGRDGPGRPGPRVRTGEPSRALAEPAREVPRAQGPRSEPLPGRLTSPASAAPAARSGTVRTLARARTVTRAAGC